MWKRDHVTAGTRFAKSQPQRQPLGQILGIFARCHASFASFGAERSTDLPCSVNDIDIANGRHNYIRIYVGIERWQARLTIIRNGNYSIRGKRKIVASQLSGSKSALIVNVTEFLHCNFRTR